MNKIKILLTFDHELSLGGVSCYNKNLFEPTYKILDLAKKINVPIVLFTDILCANKFYQWKENQFVKYYKEQLKKALLDNHDVQLHLHPHWVDSSFKERQFIPSRNFGLSEFYYREWPDNIPGIVRQGIDSLTNICITYKHQYKCVAYRAGGYNLYPRTKEILSSLYNNGIRIESSIAKGYYFKSSVSEVNFKNMPARANWFISKDGPLNQESNEGLFEIPIAAMPRTPINNLPFLMKRLIYKRRNYDTGGKGLHESNTSLFDKFIRLFPRSVWMLSFDHYTHSVADLLKILNYYVNQHSKENEIICCSISHPKSMGGYSLLLMENFVKKVRNYFGNVVEFTTCSKIYDEMRLGYR